MQKPSNSSLLNRNIGFSDQNPKFSIKMLGVSFEIIDTSVEIPAF